MKLSPEIIFDKSDNPNSSEHFIEESVTRSNLACNRNLRQASITQSWGGATGAKFGTTEKSMSVGRFVWLNSWKEWLRETPNPGWGSFWERSPFVPWFSPFEFRDVSGTGSEWTRACGFKINHLVWRERPKCDSLSYRNPGTVSLSLSLLFLLTPE